MKALLLVVTGVIGLIEILLPEPVVRLWTKAMYKNADEAEPRAWLYDAARLDGAVLVLVSLGGLFRLATATGDDEHDEAPDADAADEDE